MFACLKGREEKRGKRKRKKDWRASDTSSFAADAARCRCHLLSSMVSMRQRRSAAHLEGRPNPRDKKKESVILSRGFTRLQVRDHHIMHGRKRSPSRRSTLLKVRLAFCC